MPYSNSSAVLIALSDSNMCNCPCCRGALQQQVRSPDWGREVSEILKLGIQRPKKGHDAGDHPPITPMKAATEAELGHEAWRLYDYITRHFIATV